MIWENIKLGFSRVGNKAVFYIFGVLISAILVADGVVALTDGDFRATLLVGLSALAAIGYILYNKGVDPVK